MNKSRLLGAVCPRAFLLTAAIIVSTTVSLSLNTAHAGIVFQSGSNGLDLTVERTLSNQSVVTFTLLNNSTGGQTINRFRIELIGGPVFDGWGSSLQSLVPDAELTSENITSYNVLSPTPYIANGNSTDPSPTFEAIFTGFGDDGKFVISLDVDNSPFESFADVESIFFDDNSNLIALVDVEFSDGTTLNYSPADGDLNGDGLVNAADVLLSIRIIMGQLTPTPDQIGHGDVAPHVNGIPVSDGLFRLNDALVIQRIALGLISF